MIIKLAFRYILAQLVALKQGGSCLVALTMALTTLPAIGATKALSIALPTPTTIGVNSASQVWVLCKTQSQHRLAVTIKRTHLTLQFTKLDRRSRRAKKEEKFRSQIQKSKTCFKNSVS